jgi:hypothetical protein
MTALGFSLRYAAWLLVPVLSAICAIARADVPPRPGDHERWLAYLVTRSGHVCENVTSYRPLPGGAEYQDLTKKGLTPLIVTCTDGARFMLAHPPTVRGRPGPDASLPEPVVRPYP